MVISGDTLGGSMARRLIHSIVLVTVALGWLRLYGQRLGLYETAFAVAASALSTIVLLVFVAWHTAGTLARMDEERKSSLEDIRRLDEDLKRSEEQYRLTFENNPVPLWAYDRETLRFLAVNDAACHHYGYSREELLAMRLPDLHSVDDRPSLEERLRSLRDE